MFASNYNDPFDSNNDQQIVQNPFNIIDEFSFFNFPSPLIIPYDQLGLDQENDNFVCNQQNDQQVLLRSVDDHIVESDSTMIINMEANSNKIDMKNGLSSVEDCKKKKKKKKGNNITNHRKTQRKISPKSDRHSKINTAQGLRDRRMRLSLEVSRDFFWLQDMLGYDKPSKTIEWLLHQSKPEIVKLERSRGSQMNNYNSISSTVAATSGCEVVSSDRGSILNSTREMIKKTRKTGSHNAQAKDLRQKARARARKRTIEKIWSKGFDGYSNIMTVESNNQLYQMSTAQLSSCSPYLSIEEPIVHSSSQREQSEIHDQMMDDFESLGKYWSTTPYSNILNCLHDAAPIPKQDGFGDFKIMGKPWEGYNNYQNLC